MKAVLLIGFCSWAAFGQYKAEPAGAPPADVTPRIAPALQKTGFKIVNNGTAYCEIWLRDHLPASASTGASNLTLEGIPAGALVGVIRFDGEGSDRRGQTIPPGVYTLRYVPMPADSAHEGAAPHRDFLLLISARDDMDANAMPKVDTLVALSRRVSGTPHPAVMSVSKAEGEATVFTERGDDWVLETKSGDTAIAVVLVGIAGS